MGSWIQKASMPTPRHDLQAVAVGGKIYAISGAGYLTVDAVEIYDVETDTWTPGPPIPTKRGWLGADLLDNKIYVAGGKTIRTSEEKESSGDDTHFKIRDALEVLDLETRTWSALEPLSEPRAGVSVTACGGKIYAIDGKGDDYSDVTEIYDIESGAWSSDTPLPGKCAWLDAAVVDERIFVVGGAYRWSKDRPDYKWFDELYEFVL